MKDRIARSAFCSCVPTNINKMSEGHLLHDTKCLQHTGGKKKKKKSSFSDWVYVKAVPSVS